METFEDIRRAVIRKAVHDTINAAGKEGAFQIQLLDILKESIPDIRPSEISSAVFFLKEQDKIGRWRTSSRNGMVTRKNWRN